MGVSLSVMVWVCPASASDFTTSSFKLRQPTVLTVGAYIQSHPTILIVDYLHHPRDLALRILR